MKMSPIVLCVLGAKRILQIILFSPSICPLIIWHIKDLNTQCPPEVIVHLADFTRHWTDKVFVGQVILCQVVKKDKGAVTLKCDPGRK